MKENIFAYKPESYYKDGEIISERYMLKLENDIWEVITGKVYAESLNRKVMTNQWGARFYYGTGKQRVLIDTIVTVGFEAYPVLETLVLKFMEDLIDAKKQDK